MIVLLLTLLAIALAITLTGLFLTYRSYEPGMPWASFPPPRTGRRGIVPRHFEQDRIIRMARSVVRRRTEAWTNIAALFNVKNLFVVRAGVQTPWLGVALILVVLFLGASFVLSSNLPSSVLVDAPWANALMTADIPAHGSSLRITQQKAPAPAPVVNASKNLERLYQLGADQYNSTDEYNTWAYSACSAAAMTEVINSYGHNYRITDILKVESAIGEITPDLGLIEPSGVDKTVAKFGFKTSWLGNANGTTLDEVIKVANSGKPVIVSWPPALWDGGHILVVRGGDSDNVYLADSSRYNFTTLSRDVFLQRWSNKFAAVVEPN